MIAARVIGEVWASRKIAKLEGQKLLLVAAEDERRLVVAVDTLDARRGDRVLLSWGSGARNVLAPGEGNREVLCDAAVSLIIDGDSAGPTPGSTTEEC